MNYRRLGSSGVKVSEVALGSWLTYGNGVENDVAAKCVHHAYESGINFFDTANVYATGRAEEVVGKALRIFPRDSYVLATKVYFPMGDGPNDRGLSRKHIMEQCERSLKRLGVDYVDLYQCHRYDENTPLEETLRALDDLVSQGKVLYTGVSAWSATNINDAMHVTEKRNLHRLISNQPCYNMLTRDIERDVIPLCRREGVGQICYSPLAQGLLTGKYLPKQQLPEGSRAADSKQNIFLKDLDDDLLERIQRLKPIAQREGLSMAQLALAWCLRQDNVSSVIIGASRPAQIDDNIGATGKVLSPESLDEIDQVLLPHINN